MLCSVWGGQADRGRKVGALSLKVVLIPCFGPAKLAPPAKNRQKHGRRRLPLLGLAVLGRGRARRGGVQRRVRPLRRHRPQRVHTHLRPVRVLRGGGGGARPASAQRLRRARAQPLRRLPRERLRRLWRARWRATQTCGWRGSCCRRSFSLATPQAFRRLARGSSEFVLGRSGRRGRLCGRARRQCTMLGQIRPKSFGNAPLVQIRAKRALPSKSEPRDHVIASRGPLSRLFEASRNPRQMRPRYSLGYLGKSVCLAGLAVQPKLLEPTWRRTYLQFGGQGGWV